MIVMIRYHVLPVYQISKSPNTLYKEVVSSNRKHGWGQMEALATHVIALTASPGELEGK